MTNDAPRLPGVHDDEDAYPRAPARRRWLQGISATSLAAGPLPTLFARDAMLSFAPAAFDAAEGAALVHVHALRDTTLHIRWHTDAASFSVSEKSLHRTEDVKLGSENGFTHSFLLRELPSSASIFYAVYAAATRVSDVQRFRMPPARTANADFSLAFSGDTEERYQPFRIFDTIAARSVDAFLHLGDTVYADIPRRDFSPTLAHYRRKHATIRRDASLQKFLANHATFAMWDDHEIENDAHGLHPAIELAEQVFREFWPVRQPIARVPARTENSPSSITRIHQRAGLYRSVSLGQDIELFLLDTRRFRSPQSEPNQSAKTMLGQVQRDWFRNAYSSSNARYRLVATSVPFHGASQDAWGNYEVERDTLLMMFRDAHERDGTKTILLSADYHFAREWPRNEKRGVYEFTAGPLASFLSFEKSDSARERNSRGTHFVFGERANFGVLRYEATTKTLRVQYFDAEGLKLHERTV